MGGIGTHMSWLDANEYFFMEAVARDRLDDVRRIADVATASEAADETPREHARSVTGRGAHGMVEPWSFHTTPAPLGTPGRAES
jgi:hypothetical protein